MQRRCFVRGLRHAAAVPAARIASAERRPHVVFLNPGESVERGAGPYGRMITQFSGVALRRSEALDVRVYSKALNPRPGPYDFRLARLVEPGRG